MLRLLADRLAEHGVTSEHVRVADVAVAPGVTVDEGDGDGWPQVRTQMLAADILVLGTPIWLGHASSVCQRVLERLDGELSERDDEGRMLTFGKVGLVAVVGNEDGAHHVGAELFQGLNDVGFTLPAQAEVYWVGEAMQATDFQDLDEVPGMVQSTLATVAAHGAHLASMLAQHPYPPAA